MGSGHVPGSFPSCLESFSFGAKSSQNISGGCRKAGRAAEPGLGMGSWELGTGSWELGTGSWEMGTGSWELGAGSQEQGTRSTAKGLQQEKNILLSQITSAKGTE